MTQRPATPSGATPRYRPPRCGCFWARWSSACGSTARVQAAARASARSPSFTASALRSTPTCTFTVWSSTTCSPARPRGGAVFHPATAIDRLAIATVQAKVRRPLLASFVRRGLLVHEDAQAMAQWAHGGGFSVDASVRIAAADRAGCERLLRYCARPPLALERLHELAFERLGYDPPSSRPGRAGTLIVTPLELLDRLAALVPPRRVHRHRYYGVLAPTASGETRARSRSTSQRCRFRRSECRTAGWR